MIETKFKQTELGLVPKAWGTPTIDELIVAMNDGPFGTKLKQEHYTTKREVRIVQLGNIGENGWNDSNVKYTTFEYAKVLSSHLVNPGDVLIAKMMPAGKSIICPNHEACFIQGSDAIKVRFNDSINTQYFIYGTKSCEYLRIIEENTQGSTRQRISLTKYRTLPFIVPPIEEQVRIAEALSDVDKLIRELDTLLEKKRSIMQGVMQDLLTARRRLPGFDEPWKEETVDNICIRFDNLRIPVAETLRKKGNIPYYGANGIQDYVDGFTHDGEYILLAEDGANNLIDYPIRYVKGKIWVNNHAHVLQGKPNKVDTRYLSYGLKTIDFESNIVGNGRAKLNAKTLMDLRVVIPSTTVEQIAIAEVLSDMDAEIETLESKRDKYIAVRQGMMQQLLTGKIRLI